MALKRVATWAQHELHDFLLARASTPFAWGVHDCALFPADAIEAMTGVDIAADFRGQYHDEESAMEAIRTIAGGETVGDAAAWCAQRFDLQELDYPLMAQRGDLVVIFESGRMIAGIVHLSGRHVVAAGETGLHKLPFTSIVRAWHV